MSGKRKIFYVTRKSTEVKSTSCRVPQRQTSKRIELKAILQTVLPGRGMETHLVFGFNGFKSLHSLLWFLWL